MISVSRPAVSAFADTIVRRLRQVGTRTFFGVPGGGGNLDLIEAAASNDLPFVLTSTETGAAIAAIAQWEVTGRPGACLTTLGPGAASVVNGVACAWLDRAAIAVFTDSNPSGANGAFTHQHIDQVALFRPITKWSARLENGNFAVLDEAFRHLAALPPGPVHLDCPADVKGTPGLPFGTRPSGAGSSDQAIEMPAAFEAAIAQSRRPLLLIGLGARRPEDAAAIRRFCKKKQIPAMVTYKAKGVVPDDHPCFAGVFTNGAIERDIVEKSDLLLGVGLDPVELLPREWSFAPPIVGISGWIMPVAHVPFAAQWMAPVPDAIARLSESWKKSAWEMDLVAKAVARSRAAIDLPGKGLTAQRVVDVAAAALGDRRVTVDAGAHMFPATLRWPVSDPAGMLISNGLSTMGFALPAAIGAVLADRKPVVALTGDGGLLMCAGELLTAARERLPIITIVFNDSSLSLIEIKQQARQLRPAGVAIGDVRWQELAESLGLAAVGARTEDELAQAIELAAGIDGPSLIDVTVDRSNYGAMMKVIRG
jgi:acetolactate synthase-1/2/3 large subunit